MTARLGGSPLQALALVIVALFLIAFLILPILRVITAAFTGSDGVLETPIFSDTDVIVTRGQERQVQAVRYPPHVHQPLIQTIVDELAGLGRCPSTAESGARASWVLDRCLAGTTSA